ncbi:unnamed protein product [Penicillium manginii]
MSNIQTGAERMPHDLSHLGFLAGQIGRLITISTTPVIAGDSFEMDAVGALRLSPLRRGLAIDSTVDIFTFYVPHRHVYGEQWIKFMKDGVNATPLPTVNTTGYIDHAAFLGTINPDTNKIPKHLFQGYLNIYNNYFKAPWMPDRTEANPNELNQDDARYGFRCCHLKNIWTAPLPPETELSRQMTTSTTSIDIMGLQAAYANLHTDQERDYFMQRYHDVISSFGGKTSYDADNRPLLVMRSNLWASGYDVDGTDQTSLGQFSGRVQQTYKHSVPRFFVPEHGTMFTLALVRFPPTATKEIQYLNAKGALTYTDIAGDPVLYGNLPPREISMKDVFRSGDSSKKFKIAEGQWYRYAPSLTVNAGNGGFLHCIQMDTSVNAANQVVSVGADIAFDADPKFFACLVRFESSSVPTTLPTAYDVYPLDGRHDGGYYTVKDCVTIDVLPRTPGNNVYVGFMVWSNFTATKCRGLVSLNQVIKEIICLQPLK